MFDLYFILFLSLFLFIFKLVPLYVFPSNALLLSIKKKLMLAQIKTTTKKVTVLLILTWYVWICTLNWNGQMPTLHSAF